MSRGLGRVQRAVLEALRAGDATPRAVAESLGASPGSVRQALRSLRGRRLVEEANGVWSYVPAAGPLFDQKREGFDLLEFLATCLAFAEQDGYLSRADASLSNRTSTPDKALGYLAFKQAGQAPPPDLWLHRDGKQDWAGYTENARRIALEVSRGLSRPPRGEYERNMALVLSDQVVTTRTAGFAASMFGFQQRRREHEGLAAWVEARDSSDYFGVEGDRVELSILVHKVKPFDSYYSKKTMVQFFTQEGIGVWWASSLVTWAKEGQPYTVRATIAGHRLNSHGGTPFRETTVKCVKLLTEEGAAEQFRDELRRKHG